MDGWMDNIFTVYPSHFILPLRTVLRKHNGRYNRHKTNSIDLSALRKKWHYTIFIIFTHTFDVYFTGYHPVTLLLLWESTIL